MTAQSVVSGVCVENFGDRPTPVPTGAEAPRPEARSAQALELPAPGALWPLAAPCALWAQTPVELEGRRQHSRGGPARRRPPKAERDGSEKVKS